MDRFPLRKDATWTLGYRMCMRNTSGCMMFVFLRCLCLVSCCICIWAWLCLIFFVRLSFELNPLFDYLSASTCCTPLWWLVPLLTSALVALGIWGCVPGYVLAHPDDSLQRAWVQLLVSSLQGGVVLPELVSLCPWLDIHWHSGLLPQTMGVSKQPPWNSAFWLPGGRPLLWSAAFWGWGKVWLFFAGLLGLCAWWQLGVSDYNFSSLVLMY